MPCVDEHLESVAHQSTPLVVDVAIGSAQDLLGCSDLLSALDHVDFDGERRECLCFAHLSHSDCKLKRFGTSGEIEPVQLADAAAWLHMDDDAVQLRHLWHRLTSVFAAVLRCALVIESVSVGVDRQLHSESESAEQ